MAQPGGQMAFADDFADGQIFRSLSDQHREVLVLTKIIGFSIAETAEKLNISESATKVRVHRAMGTLRQLMAREEW
jgi:RNA polymerase sigma-70 factor (ECF subfamily)